jgi:hypothetical protein
MGFKILVTTNLLELRDMLMQRIYDDVSPDYHKAYAISIGIAERFMPKSAVPVVRWLLGEVHKLCLVPLFHLVA